MDRDSSVTCREAADKCAALIGERSDAQLLERIDDCCLLVAILTPSSNPHAPVGRMVRSPNVEIRIRPTEVGCAVHIHASNYVTRISKRKWRRDQPVAVGAVGYLQLLEDFTAELSQWPAAVTSEAAS